jgi:hypothetical protein
MQEKNKNFLTQISLINTEVLKPLFDADFADFTGLFQTIFTGSLKYLALNLQRFAKIQQQADIYICCF